MAVGNELLSNGDFTDNVDGWTADGVATITWNPGGYADIGPGSFDFIHTTPSAIKYRHFYAVSFTIQGVVGSSLRVQLGNSTIMYYVKNDGQFGEKLVIIRADADDVDLNFSFFSSSPGTLASVSVREVTPNIDLDLGPELVTNGGFTGSAAGWSVGASWTYGSNRITASGSGTGSQRTLSQNVGAAVPKQYLITMDIGISSGGGTVDIEFGDGNSDFFIPDGTGLIHAHIVLQSINLGSSNTLFILAGGLFNSWIDNVSVKEILGLLPNGTLPTYNPSIITSVKRVEQNLSFPQYIVAGQGTGGLYQLFKKDETQDFTLWRSPVYNIGKNFDILSISFNLPLALSTSTEIIPKLYFDNERDSSAGTVINITNYSDKFIKLNSKSFDNSVSGQHNFFLEFQFTGTDLAVVSLPITIEIDEHDT